MFFSWKPPANQSLLQSMGAGATCGRACYISTPACIRVLVLYICTGLVLSLRYAFTRYFQLLSAQLQNYTIAPSHLSPLSSLSLPPPSKGSNSSFPHVHQETSERHILPCYKCVVKNGSRAALEVSWESRWLRKGGSVGRVALPIVFFVSASDFLLIGGAQISLKVLTLMDKI
jgi:hypothetical protein